MSESPSQSKRSTPWVIPLVAIPGLLFLHSILRLALFLKFGPTGASATHLLKTFGIGLLADCFVALVALLPAVAFLALVPSRVLRWRITQLALKLGFLFATALSVFFIVAEYFFFE